MTEYGATSHNYLNNDVNDRRLTLEYGDPVLGVPVAKKAEETITSTSMPGNTMQITYLIDVISLDEVPKEEFFLSFYGLPEPKFSRSGFGSWVWYLIGGAICLVLGTLIMKRRKARG